MIGTTVSHYKILEKLGGGAAGVVYKGQDTKLKRPVALKFLPAELTQDPDSKGRFLREARAASALDHTNICGVHEIDETEDGQIFMVLSYYEGETLKRKIRRGALQPDQAIDIGVQLARGLAKAHAKGIIHRDIKPANIMITNEGVVKILDFGLAKLQGQTEPTTAGTIVGTLAYMSPEQARGEEVDQRSDIWSLGVVFYEMLTGQLPFRSEDEGGMVYSILNRDAQPITAVRKGVPAGLQRIVSRAMAKRPEERYQRAGEVVVDLKTFKGISETETTMSIPIAEAYPKPSNLPLRLTSFVGRDRQMSDIKQLLGENRLVTLTGAAGCGKTRLALEATWDLLEDWPDGVWLVELAPLADPSLVPQTVAVTLGLKEEANRALTQTLVDYLKDRILLLVIDNCEHLISACATLIEELLRACPKLRILATSREGLGITGEVIYHLLPLVVPGAEAQLPLKELSQIEAVRLFVERAGAVHTGFSLTEENAPAVVQICRRLDGIPLALELGAARVSVLPVEEIAKRLDDRFGLLTAGRKTGLPHHQTLRALIDWGYDQLSGDERKLFCRLSVFAGGWTLQSAETVCRWQGIDKGGFIDLHSRLVAKSLVEMESESAKQAKEVRYRMLATVQEYARNRLEQEEGDVDVRRRHEDYFLALAREAERHLTGPAQAEWVARLEAEHENLRATIDGYLGSSPNAQLALEMAGGLGRYWFMRGRWSEGRALLSEILARPDAGERTSARATALDWTTWLAYWQGDFEKALALGQESLSIWKDVGDASGLAQTLNNLGAVTQELGDYAKSRQYHEKSLAFRRQIGDRRAIAVSLHNLGELCLRQGDYAQARAVYQESLRLFREVGHLMGVADSLSSLAVVAEHDGELDQARAYHEEALKNRRDRKDPMGTSESLHSLGELAARQGQSDQARSYYAQSLAIRQKLGDRMHVADSLEALGILVVASEDLAYAARLLGAASSLREKINAPPSPAKQEKLDKAISTTRSAMGESSFTKEWDQGRAMSMEQAVDCVLKKDGEEHAG
jgi:predicted ATPase/tRNA A-37 threonylcarbamoyl transferase component Bud32/Tfp pilus assembly protein PilF